MYLKKAIMEHYRKTGILGAYETAEIQKLAENCAAEFDDADAYYEDRHATIQRQMDIQGKRFKVCSVFQAASFTTPTEKLLTLIDADLEKENRTS